MDVFPILESQSWDWQAPVNMRKKNEMLRAATGLPFVLLKAPGIPFSTVEVSKRIERLETRTRDLAVAARFSHGKEQCKAVPKI